MYIKLIFSSFSSFWQRCSVWKSQAWYLSSYTATTLTNTWKTFSKTCSTRTARKTCSRWRKTSTIYSTNSTVVVSTTTRTGSRAGGTEMPTTRWIRWCHSRVVFDTWLIWTRMKRHWVKCVKERVVVLWHFHSRRVTWHFARPSHLNLCQPIITLLMVASPNSNIWFASNFSTSRELFWHSW